MNRSLAAPAIAIAVVVGAVVALQVMQGGPRSGYAAAEFSLQDLDGRTWTLADLRGRIVFLNLWATWCPPCRAEMPGMEKLWQRFRERDFVMLAVSEDSDGATNVAPFVRELGLTFPILLDPDNRLPGRYGVTGYPETFVIGRDGQVIRHVIGPAEWDSPEEIAYFEELLAAAPAAP